MNTKHCNDPYPHKDHTWVTPKDPPIGWWDRTRPTDPIRYDEHYCPGVKRVKRP